MRFRLGVIAMVAALVALIAAGCASRQQTGSIVGAGAGAAVGGALTGSTWGAIAGGALGAWAGSEIGAELDRRDQERIAYALREVPVGQEYSWVNPDTGAYWEVTPQQTYRAPQGYPCREFSMLGRGPRGEVHETTGTACLTPGDTWEIVG